MTDFLSAHWPTMAIVALIISICLILFWPEEEYTGRPRHVRDGKEANTVADAELKQPYEVKCEECKHKIEVQDAQKIENRGYYCLMHRRPYDKEVQGWGEECEKFDCKEKHIEPRPWGALARRHIAVSYFKIIPPVPSYNQEVDVEGKPVNAVKVGGRK